MTVYFLNPDYTQKPSGGVRKLFTFAQHLIDHGIPTAVVSGVKGHVPEWFTTAVPIVYAPVPVSHRDLLAVPEWLGPKLGTVAPGVPRVSINQNAFYTFNHVVKPVDHPYLTSRDLVTTLTVSDHNAEMLRVGFPDLELRRVHYGLDPGLYTPPESAPERRIGYMPRKRADDARRVLGLLTTRGALDGWDVVAIDGLTEAETADVLRSCALFLSFSEIEGFGLPPAEAMACGAHVIGYTGFGGREFFHPDYSVPVEDGDAIGFVEHVLHFLDNFDSCRQHQSGRAAAQWILGEYSVARESAEVVEFFREALTIAANRPPACGVIDPTDTWLFGPKPLRALAQRVLRR